MKIWAVANQKGGVGKTTSVVSIGGLLASQDQRVLLLDMDPHGSLTSYFKYNPDEIEKYSVIKKYNYKMFPSGRGWQAHDKMRQVPVRFQYISVPLEPALR